MLSDVDLDHKTVQLETITNKYTQASKESLKFAQSIKEGKVQLQQGQTYLQAYEAQLKSTSFSFKNLGKSALSGLKALGAGAINALGGMAIGALVSGGISLISKGIDKLFNSEKKRQEELQEMASKAEEAKSNIESLTSSMSDHEKTVNDVKHRYAELAQGVKNLGKSNQSQGILSNKEYDEFLEISDKLVDVMPSLSSGYQDQEHSILTLTGSYSELIDKLDESIAKEKELSEIEIRKNLEDLTVGEKHSYIKSVGEKSNAQLRFSVLDNFLTDYDNLTTNQFFNKYIVEGLQDDIDILEEEFKKLGLEDIFQDIMISAKNSAYGDDYNWNIEEQYHIKDKLAVARKEYNEQIKLFDKEINDSNKIIANNILAGFDSDIQNLGSVGSELAKALLSNVDYGKIDNPRLYAEQLINSINEQANNPELINAWTGLLSVDTDYALGEADEKIREYLSQIASLLDIDVTQLTSLLGYDERLDLKNKLKDKYVGQKTGVKSYTTENGEQRYYQSNTDGYQTYLDFIDSLENPDEAQLILDASIDEDSMNWTTEQWRDFLNELKKDASIKIETKLDPVKPLSEMKSAFSDFESIYNDIHNNSFVASDAIEKLNEAFGDLTLADGTNALQEFKDILTTMPDDVEAQQKALEKLGTLYLDNSDLLKNLNEENKEYTIRQLEAIGVTNAREVVEDRLNRTEEDLSKSENVLNILSDITANKQANVADETQRAAYAKRASEIASTDLENATIDEIAQLIAEAKDANIDATALANLAAEKIASNKSVITTDGDVKNLADLADQLTGTNTNAALYAKMMDYISKGWYPAAAALESQIRQNSITAQLNAGKHKNTVISYAAPSSNNSDSSGGSGGDSEEAFEETIDWIETKIQRITSFIQDIKKSADNTYDDWSLRNTELANEISFVNEELQIQYKAYKRYMKEANSIDLSETYKEKVRGGKIDIETITDEDLKSKIDLYKQWYEKALSASDAIHDLHINLSELAEQKFNNVKSEYEGLISLIESSSSLIESKLSNIEARGYFANSKYYENLRKLEQEKYSDLYKEYDALTKKFNEAVSTGKVEENSEAWINMKNEISNVEKSLIDCNTQIVDLNKNIRDLNWEKFDYAEERIGKITEEANFLIDLLDRDSLYEDNGKFNNKGMATLGLRGINYNTYMQQSRNYANELIKTERDLADNPYNKELIARREELLELQQDAISNSESEKDAIKSLVQEGINLHLESLSNIIDKYKESLSAAKDLYDYQKNLTDQTKEIASLEKIMMAYSGDDSEGTRKIVQETKLKLEEAKTNLQETQWDRYISDTEKLLDDLYNDYSEVLNEVLNDTNNLIKNVIGDINSNSKDIQSAINSVSKDVGYTLSDNFNKAINGKKDIVSVYIDGISKTTTNIYNVINQILNFVSSMSTKMDGWLKNTDGSWSYMNNGFETKNGWINSNNKWYHFDENGIMESNKWIKNNNGKWSYVDENGESVSGWKQIKYQGQNTWFNFDKDGYLKTDTWIGNYFVDKNGAMKTNTWIGHNGKYYWVGKDGKWQDLPGWYKDKKPNDGYPLYEYAKGSKYIGKDQWAWTQEEGTEIIYRTKDGAMLTPLGQGDKVYTKDMSDVLWNFAKANVGNSFSTIRSIPNIQKSDIGSIVNNDNAISITLPNVKNYSEFKRDLQNDSKFQSFVQDITVGQMFGKGKLNKNKYM